MKCSSCGAQLDFTQSTCPACGREVELGRLTGILGIVCRRCDAYNEPGSKVCLSCNSPLGGTAADREETAVELPAPPLPRIAPKPPQEPTPGKAAQAPQAPASAPPPGPTAPPAQPVVRSYHRGGPPRVPPSSQRTPGAIPLLTRCPRCGAEASAGAFCPQCGQALGSRGTQYMAPVGEVPLAIPRTYAELPKGSARLVLERGQGREGEVYRLEKDLIEVGRTKGALLFPDDPTLAPHHASFLFRHGSLHVRDEGAPGGIHLRLRGLSIPLKPGDELVVGDQLLRFKGLLPKAPAPPEDGTQRLGAPRPAGKAVVLEELLEGGLVGRVFIREGPSIKIGRVGCAVNLGDDPYLSQAHAEILVDSTGSARLRDLGSSNGTFARLPTGSERELRDADVVRMGREVLRVSFSERPG